MKRILLTLALLWSAQAAAQTCATWCAAGVSLSAQTVAISGGITTVASFTSAAAIAGTTLDVEIHDPSGTKVAQTWQVGVTFAAGQTIAAAPVIFQAAAGVAVGTYTVNMGVFDSTGAQLFWASSVATFTVTATPGGGPACLPRVQWPLAVVWGSMPAGVSTRFDTYAVWVCNLPGGYLTTSTMFVLSNVAPFALQYAAGLWTKAQAAADCTATCVPSTPAELAFITGIMQSNRPTALVAFNGASSTRSVFSTNADGTLNASPIAGESVAVGTHCDETRRIQTAPAYFSVAGQKDQGGSPFASGIYALCVVSLPNGSN